MAVKRLGTQKNVGKRNTVQITNVKRDKILAEASKRLGDIDDKATRELFSTVLTILKGE